MTRCNHGFLVLLCFLFLFLVFLATNASALPICPEAFMECLPSADESLSDRARFRRGGARGWEIDAWRAISSGSIGKGPLDVIEYRQGWVDLGYYHLRFRPGDDLLGVGVTDVDWALAVLYVDRANYDFAIQRGVWRGRVSPAVREARRTGLSGDELAAFAALANSGPERARSIAEEAGWCMYRTLDLYAITEHRARRAAWIRSELLR